MPNWQELVRQRLVGLDLEAPERDEVHAELAAHLEESYEIFCKQGLREGEAARRALEQVSNWNELQRKISAVKRREYPMKKRAHQLWVPGFLTLILSTICLMVFQKLGFRPRIVGSGADPTLFYVPWLLSLPLLGALGAYVSARAGSSRTILLLASIFPVIALTAAFLLMFPIDIIIEPIVGNHVDFRVVASAILKDGTSWLLVPGAALFLGGLSVSVFFRRRPTPRSTTMSPEAPHA